MKIVVNTDGVVFDIIASLNKACESQGYNNYDYHDWAVNNHHDDLIAEIISSNLFWWNLKPFEDSWHQLNHWFSIGHSIISVSSRQDSEQRLILEKSLDNWRIPCSIPIYSKDYDKYWFVDKSYKSDYLFIDDNPISVGWLIDNDFNAVMRRAWYNRSFWEELPSVGNLYEIKI